ncbi:hypothetical protein SAMN06313540_10216 [Epsilonproteobacteria bacterium SCGC AD-308-E02]|nr:hypothetical protein SAMN06313540_10216 [Epsilonproteobacteria bacterium SCGC AD-308-E02]
MATVIATVTNLVGRFYIKGPDGSIHELSNGDKIHEGETVVGDRGNTVTAQLTASLNGGSDILVKAKESQLFDASLSTEKFTLDETVSQDNAFAGLRNDGDDTQEKADDEVETAAGEAGTQFVRSSDASGKSNFAVGNNGIVDIEAQTRNVPVSSSSAETGSAANYSASLHAREGNEDTGTARDSQTGENIPAEKTIASSFAPYELSSDDTATTGTVTIIPVSDDNLLHAKEAAEDTVTVRGTAVGGDIAEGDTVTVTINGNNYITAVQEDGSYSVDVEISDLLEDETIEVSVESNDVNGNEVISFAEVTVFLDTAPQAEVEEPQAEEPEAEVEPEVEPEPEPEVEPEVEPEPEPEVEEAQAESTASTPTISISVVSLSETVEQLINYDTDGGRNANNIETMTFADALAIQNGTNHSADNLVFKNINSSDISFGTDTSDKVVVVTGNVNGNKNDHTTIDMGEGGNNVLIFTNHSPDNHCDIIFAETGNNVVILPISSYEYVAGDYSLTNVDGIYFLGDGKSFGDVSSAMESVVTNPNEFSLDISAFLTDTDGSESLSDITIDNLPVGTTIEGIDANPDGSYTIPIDENGGSTSVTLIGESTLDPADLSGITASVQSTESNGGEIATATTTAEIETGAGNDTVILDAGDTVDGGTGFDILVVNEGGAVDFGTISDNISNIESIDANNGEANTLSMSVDDLLSMTDENNVIHITLDEHDTLNIDTSAEGNASEWTLGEITIHNEETGTDTQQYINSESNDTITVEIHTEIHVDNN